MIDGELCVGVVQLTSASDVKDNLERACYWVEQAARAGAALIALPENFGFLGIESEILAHAQTLDGPFTAPLRKLAHQFEVVILAGSIPERGPDPKHVYNTSVLIGTDGLTKAAYRKIHLFDVEIGGPVQFQESKQVIPGHEPVVTEVHGWPLGLSVCYDLRFPELYRQLVSQGARVLTVPSAFTLHTGKDHWEVLLRARAIENQCYVLAPAQFGNHGHGRQSWGKAMIIDPWGTMLATAPEREGFVSAVLESKSQDTLRASLPCLHNRRL
jgi:deaminated glutathione amidase